MKKNLTFLFYFVCLACILTIPASAYVDPSVTTFAYTAIVFVVVAAAATIGAFLRKAKKKAQEVLHIDENAGKTVEEEVVVFDEAGKTAEAAAAEEKTQE